MAVWLRRTFVSGTDKVKCIRILNRIFDGGLSRVTDDLSYLLTFLPRYWWLKCIKWKQSEVLQRPLPKELGLKSLLPWLRSPHSTQLIQKYWLFVLVSLFLSSIYISKNGLYSPTELFSSEWSNQFHLSFYFLCVITQIYFTSVYKLLRKDITYYLRMVFLLHVAHPNVYINILILTYILISVVYVQDCYSL